MPGSPACRHYSRAYLHHLDRCGEILGSRLNTIHNLHFYQRLMGELRDAIANGRFDAWRRAFAERRAGAIAGATPYIASAATSSTASV